MLQILEIALLVGAAVIAILGIALRWSYSRHAERRTMFQATAAILVAVTLGFAALIVHAIRNDGP